VALAERGAIGAAGEDPSSVCRCIRIDAAVPTPEETAISSTGRPVRSRSVRARSTRCWISHHPGEADFVAEPPGERLRAG